MFRQHIYGFALGSNFCQITVLPFAYFRFISYQIFSVFIIMKLRNLGYILNYKIDKYHLL